MCPRLFALGFNLAQVTREQMSSSFLPPLRRFLTSFLSFHLATRTTDVYIFNRCGPCLLMSPEFEAAAKDLEGKVRFVKLDTDLEPQMAGRLGIMGLPTLLFLDKNDDTEAVEQGKAPMAVLKERIEGALRKDSIVDLCNYHFFQGPMPTQLS